MKTKFDPDRRDAAGPKLENLTLWQRVHEHLREEILANRLPPGTELQEAALAETLGVSRGPVREAIGRLAAEGLVTVRPRRGAVVRPLSKAEFLEAYQVREALETLAMRLAVPRMTSDALASLEWLVERMAEQAAQDDVKGFFATNGTFHEAVVAASGNRKLQEIHHQLMAQMGRYQMRSLALRGSLERSIAEHRAILAAARAGDVEGAVRLLGDHIRIPQHRLESGATEELIALGISNADERATGERATDEPMRASG
jgi:DNA-binding GntR family transcriptional regulator